ncbi:hypothetical protein EIP91_004449 [Steccherinum ochraceum]|uniref:Histone deacetylase n=1 Tax=Steccherinum ochraceum TaxID=92696 RepID=A0A4V6N741_9APHY|nr:hypothetical protein EIP91_004449 [Steccherinum ochraceum]
MSEVDVVIADACVPSATQRRRVAYVVSNELAKVASLLPSNLNRSLMVHSLAKAFGLLSPRPELRLLRPIPAKMSDLAIYHTREYLDYVLSHKITPHSNNGTDIHVELGLEEARFPA